AVVAPIEYHREIAAPEVLYTRARTDRRVKATLPAPYIIGRRMWHPEHSRRAYPTREKLMHDCVGILRREIEAVRAAGAATVQLDEPWLAVLVDPKVRAEDGIPDVRHQMDLCADLPNQTRRGPPRSGTAVPLLPPPLRGQPKAGGSHPLHRAAARRGGVGTFLPRPPPAGRGGGAPPRALPRRAAARSRLHRPLRPP